MRKLLILIGLVLLSVAVPAAPVLADPPDPDFFDFTVGLHEWEFVHCNIPNSGEQVNGFGIRTNHDADGGCDNLIRMEYFYAETVTLTSVTVTFAEPLEAGYIFVFGASPWDFSPGVGGPLLIDEIADGGETEFEWTGSQVSGGLSFQFLDGQDIGEEMPHTQGIESIAVEYLIEHEYVRPLAAADLEELVANPNPASSDADNAVFAISNQQTVNVHAAADGVITEMRPATQDDCEPNFNNAQEGLFGPPLICSVLLVEDGTPYYLDGLRDGAIAGNTWFVRLLGDDSAEFTYFVSSPDVYLSEGQSITAGCVIGRTILLDNGETPPNYVAGTGLAIVAVREAGTIIDSLDAFTIEPDASIPCNVAPENENCMGDVQLNDASQWELSDGVIWNSPGARLLGSLNARIRTTMNLDAAQKPELIVRARASGGGNGNVELTLGQTTQEFSISEAAGYQNLTIAGDEHEPDGTFYTVRITNTGTSTIDVQSICVRFTDDGEGNPVENPDQPPPPCIFSNNSFNEGTAGWSVSSTEPGPGEIRVASGGTFAQNISVPAGTYDLTIVAAIWHYDSLVPDDEDADDVEIEYDPFGAGSVALDSHTYGEFVQNNNVVVFSTSLVVATDSSGVFLFEVALNDPATGVRGLAIRSACIGDEGSGEGGGGSGNGDGIFTPNCSGNIATPTGNDFGVWISWHWSQLNKFYRCELIILLNDQFKFLQKSWITVTWSIRWGQASAVQTINWFGKYFVGWLGGHLSNIALGQVTTISTSEQCGNIFCAATSLFNTLGDVLNNILNGITGISTGLIDLGNNIVDAVEGLGLGLIDLAQTLLDGLLPAIYQIVVVLLGIFSGVIGLLGTVLLGIFSFLFDVIERAIGLFDLLRLAILTMVEAWINAPVAVFPEFPNCSFDGSQPLCLVFWMLNNTVFSSYGQYFMWVVAIGMWLNLFVWIIRKCRQALMDLGVLI